LGGYYGDRTYRRILL
jgi:hypothetical protein